MGGNPELYDPTDTCWPTVGRLTTDSLTSGVARQSLNCRGSVGLVSAKCRLFVTLVRVRRYIGE